MDHDKVKEAIFCEYIDRLAAWLGVDFAEAMQAYRYEQANGFADMIAAYKGRAKGAAPQPPRGFAAIMEDARSPEANLDHSGPQNKGNLLAAFNHGFSAGYKEAWKKAIEQIGKQQEQLDKLAADIERKNVILSSIGGDHV